MINLIPPGGHKTIKYEYVLRVGSVLGFLFATVFILLSIVLIPTYVLVGAQIKAFEAEKNQSSEVSDTLNIADQEVRITGEMLAQLKRIPAGELASVAISEIKNVAPSTIIFTNFIAEAPQGDIQKIQIQGNAPTRESLAELKNSLENSPMFEKAEVPISDLARDVDVPFAISVMLTQK
jgi:hypothetical protein